MWLLVVLFAALAIATETNTLSCESGRLEVPIGMDAYLSEARINGKRTPYNPGSTEVVTNDAGYVVGEIVGSGVNLVLGVNFTGTVQLCLLLTPNVTIDTTWYPIPDFAMYNSSTVKWTPLDLTITVNAGPPIEYCADVSTSGFYYPINRMANWTTFVTTTSTTQTTTTHTTTTTATTFVATTTPAPGGLSTAAIVGIVVGSVAGGLLVIAIGVVIYMSASGAGGAGAGGAYVPAQREMVGAPLIHTRVAHVPGPRRR